MMELGLGRRHDPDPRDQGFLIATVVRAPVRTWRYWWANGLWSDQGSTGTCVGHAWAHYIEDGPRTHPGTIDPYLIYCEACKRDVWAANDNCDPNFGTSVRAAAKYLQEVGRIDEYLWAWDLPTVEKALLTVGPVVVGTNWYNAMFFPHDDGFIDVSGRLAGGHAYVLNGINTREEKIRIKNSWGRGWGRDGTAWIRYDDFARLLGENGEACLTVYP